MQGRGRAPLIRTARGRWLLVATAVASALVLALSAGLQAFLGQLSGNIATDPMAIIGKTFLYSTPALMVVLGLARRCWTGTSPWPEYNRGKVRLPCCEESDAT